MFGTWQQASHHKYDVQYSSRKNISLPFYRIAKLESNFNNYCLKIKLSQRKQFSALKHNKPRKLYWPYTYVLLCKGHNESVRVRLSSDHFHPSLLTPVWKMKDIDDRSWSPSSSSFSLLRNVARKQAKLPPDFYLVFLRKCTKHKVFALGTHVYRNRELAERGRGERRERRPCEVYYSCTKQNIFFFSWSAASSVDELKVP